MNLIPVRLTHNYFLQTAKLKIDLPTGGLPTTFNPYLSNITFPKPLKTSQNLSFLMFSGGIELTYY